jgi:hypothetical protein
MNRENPERGPRNPTAVRAEGARSQSEKNEKSENRPSPKHPPNEEGRTPAEAPEHGAPHPETQPGAG